MRRRIPVVVLVLLPGLLVAGHPLGVGGHGTGSVRRGVSSCALATA